MLKSLDQRALEEDGGGAGVIKRGDLGLPVQRPGLYVYGGVPLGCRRSVEEGAGRMGANSNHRHPLAR